MRGKTRQNKKIISFNSEERGSIELLAIFTPCIINIINGPNSAFIEQRVAYIDIYPTANCCLCQHRYRRFHQGTNV